MKYPRTIMTYLIWLISSCAYGQENRTPINIGDSNIFLIDTSRLNAQTTWDTLNYPNGKINAIGKVVLYKNKSKSKFKVGFWKYYFENGQLKAEGNFCIDFYIICGWCLPVKEFYYYKTGLWKFYYDNGQTMTIGTYKVKKEKINNNCKGGDKIKISHMDKTWVCYTDKGDIIKATKDIIKNIENASP